MRLGLCGWTINAETYFQHFDALEVQQTFYEPPSRVTMDRWREQAPDGFVFTIKAWQIITHRSTSTTYRRLKTEVDRDECGAFRVNDTVLAAWQKTRECARILRAKAILFQCPASFKPTDENVENMRRFFGGIERMKNVAYLWEPRGAWPDDLLLDVCRELRLVHTVDPFLRDSVTPELTYWRLHGIGSHYRPYTDDELQSLAARVPHDDTWVMFNNIPRVGDAKRFRTAAAKS
ncbi:MAG TPA: DUF72 domain-containing protein [Thermoanaerobaculia bacterium]|jgi:uncharacterized protein YecE (DUF72 family)|nr:DUF72 domain-containing protein [Thermoanaerobaculia bacterium]